MIRSYYYICEVLKHMFKNNSFKKRGNFFFKTILIVISLFALFSDKTQLFNGTPMYGLEMCDDPLLQYLLQY